MERRNFIKNISLGTMALGLPLNALFASCNSVEASDETFHKFVSELLKDWCDGMVRNQTIDPGNPEVHGSLDCPACEHIHGRCMDAVYPFLYMADKSGDKKYLDAAILVMEWAENNVSQSDGSWTVIPNPKSWKGITVFGAIALAEALHYHGHILDKKLLTKWSTRLEGAAEYIYDKFDLSFTNINYGATAIYGLYLLGNVLKNQKYINRSHELAGGIHQYFTKPNFFLYGEGKPSDKKSEKGLPVIDLGYNVEESLSNLVLYAVETNNNELKDILEKSLNTHLEFMLPDGAWDNSWGTRQYKWSYWGSRTCDGSQLTYAYLSGRNPAFTTAVVKNTELLKVCTDKGLLHGGPHYINHGIKPCIHHTFEHAKPLTTLLNNWEKLKHLNNQAQLPREHEYGAKYFSEIDTALLARGNWRGTVTAYDAIYKNGDYRQAAGGSLSVLYHKQLGLIFAASMAKYKLAEKNNQQPNPGADFALTPRIETFIDNKWYTNLYDLAAEFEIIDEHGVSACIAQVELKNDSYQTPLGVASPFQLSYENHSDRFVIKAKPKENNIHQTNLILPVISNNGESIRQLANNKVVFQKKNGDLVLEANVPLKLKVSGNERIFNMVPGVEAAPVIADFDDLKNEEIVVTIYHKA